MESTERFNLLSYNSLDLFLVGVCITGEMRNESPGNPFEKNPNALK
jgi:hypothetical protein